MCVCWGQKEPQQQQQQQPMMTENMHFFNKKKTTIKELTKLIALAAVNKKSKERAEIVDVVVRERNKTRSN